MDTAHQTLALLVLLLLSGCDSCSGERATPEARAPEPPPEGLVWELSIGGGAEAMAAFNAALPPGRARLLVPETPGELVDCMVTGLDLGARVPDDAAFHALGLRLPDGVWNVSAVRVTLDPIPTSPLGDGVPLHAGAPFDGRFVGSVPGPEDVAAVLVDDVLVFGERREPVERALGYLAFTRMPAEVPDHIALDATPELAGDLRAVLDQLVRRTARDLRAAAAEARAAHDAPPDFGDPETVVRILEESATGFIALLPDLDAMRVTVQPGAGGLTLDAELDVREESPLAELLAHTPTGDARALAGVPRGAALAWLFRSGRRAAHDSFVTDVARIGGERLSPEDHAALEALARALTEGDADTRVVALGGDGDGAFASYAIPDAHDLDDTVLLAAASRPYVQNVLGQAFGCAAGHAGPSWPTAPDDGEASRAWTICGDRALRLHTDDAGIVLGVTRAPTTLDVGEPSPDLARALAALGDELVFALSFTPSRAAAVAPLLDIAPLTAIAARLDATERDAPVVLGLSKRDGGLSLRVIVTTNAIEDALSLLATFD